MDEFLDFLKCVILPVVLVWCLVMAIILAATTTIDSRDCRIYGEQTGHETKYIFMSTCYVKDESGWLTYDQYSKTLTARSLRTN